VKPSNLLLDVRGTVWVTDFGLAKRVDQNNLTGPGETAGTLRYMPPERFNSQSDIRGDVYSLGLTLYELLTLRPAFDESDHERLLKQVTHGVPPAPRQCDSSIPLDLETVVLKAMARDPAHRYQTAMEMADDLRRFLANKPVHARRVRPAELVWRWCRRNPAVAGLLAIVVSLLILVAVIATGGYLQTREALGREANLNAAAQEQQRRAEENLALAMRAFDQIFTQATRRGSETGIDDDDSEPAGPPLVSPDVAAILQNLLKFYDQFGERNRLDPRLQREIAKAYRRVGDIEQRLGQFENAESAYRHALTIYERYAGAYGNPIDTREMAVLENDLGLVLQMIGRLGSAERMHSRALRTLLPHSESAAARSELARTHTILGSLHDKLGFPGSEASHRSAMKLINELISDDPFNPDYQLALARCHRNLCIVLSRKGKRDQAIAAQDKAVTILDKLVITHSAVPDYRCELGEVLMLSFLVWQGGPLRDAEADRRLARAVDLTKELAADFPTVPQYQALRVRALQRYGESRQAAGQDDVEIPLRDAVSQQRIIVSQFPKIPVYQLYLAQACHSLGKCRQRRDDWNETIALMTEAVAAQRCYLKANPRSRLGWFSLSSQYQILADALRRQGESEKAAAADRKADEARKGR
jgi:tetratricopeptide (TPR) repeat protein